MDGDPRTELVALMAERESRTRQRALYRYAPYPKQAEFHALGATHSERALIAANQVGKTWAAGFEAAMHATGRYPAWWQGRRWNRPTIGWVASETMEVSRDAAQRILLGRADYRGTGAIPGDAILDLPPYPNVKDAVALVKVRHVSGGVSVIAFKSYDSGRKKFQGETIDWGWADEEPAEDIYTEMLTRTNATHGLMMATFTPLLGMSEVVKKFLIEPPESCAHVTMGLADALHYTPEQRAAIIARYPEHEREARTQGIPQFGSGRVFPAPESMIVVDSVDLKPEWPRIAGIDFGWDHPTAGAWLAWDRDRDVVYLYDDYSMREATPLIHASAFRRRGALIPIAWPHDGLQHDKGSGVQLAEQYRAEGLAMLAERATFEDGSNGVEAGIMDMIDRMQTGRFKVARACTNWLAEYRLYHREKGLIVKINDDCISASRYALMMLRYASTGQPKKRVHLTFGSEFARA